MRCRDIKRLWAQIVRSIGKDKLTPKEWQDYYEDFWRCMQSPSDPYICIESVDHLLPYCKVTPKEKKQKHVPKKDTKKFSHSEMKVLVVDEHSPSEESVPFSIWESQFKRETNPDLHTNNIILRRTAERKKTQKKKPAVEQADQIKLQMEQETEVPIKKRKMDAKTQKDMTLFNELSIHSQQKYIPKRKKSTKKEAETKEIVKQTKERAKIKSKKQNAMRTTRSQTAKAGKKAQMLLKDQRQKQIITPESKQTKSKNKKSKKPIDGHKQQAHRSPSPLDLTIEASSSYPSVAQKKAPKQLLEIVEDLSLPVIRNENLNKKNESKENQFGTIDPTKANDSNIFKENLIKNGPIQLAKPITAQHLDIIRLLNDDNHIVEAMEIDEPMDNIPNDISSKDVEQIEVYLENYNDKIPSEKDYKISATSEFFDNLSNITTIAMNKTPLELDAIVHDTLNYDEDIEIDDSISVATSWDGEEDKDTKIVEVEKEQVPVYEPVKSKLSELRSFRIRKIEHSNLPEKQVHVEEGQQKSQPKREQEQTSVQELKNDRQTKVSNENQQEKVAHKKSSRNKEKAKTDDGQPKVSHKKTSRNKEKAKTDDGQPKVSHKKKSRNKEKAKTDDGQPNFSHKKSSRNKEKAKTDDGQPNFSHKKSSQNNEKAKTDKWQEKVAHEQLSENKEMAKTDDGQTKLSYKLSSQNKEMAKTDNEQANVVQGSSSQNKEMANTDNEQANVAHEQLSQNKEMDKTDDGQTKVSYKPSGENKEMAKTDNEQADVVQGSSSQNKEIPKTDNEQANVAHEQLIQNKEMDKTDDGQTKVSYKPSGENKEMAETDNEHADVVQGSSSQNKELAKTDNEQANVVHKPSSQNEEMAKTDNPLATVAYNLISLGDQQPQNQPQNALPVPARRVSVFASPHSQPTAVSFGTDSYKDSGWSKTAIFGIKCWGFFDGRCEKSNCNHLLNSIGDVQRTLSQMSIVKLCDTYSFILRHGILFRKYFNVFAEIFARGGHVNQLQKMVQDCALYFGYCSPFLYDIYTLQVRSGVKPKDAAAPFMQHLFKPDMAALLPELFVQLLKILANADWYNYIDLLCQLIYIPSFVMPVEFMQAVTTEAVTKGPKFLVTRVIDLLFIMPVTGPSLPATTMSISILQKAGYLSRGLPADQQFQQIVDQHRNPTLLEPRKESPIV